jgi:hypothetical protein
MSSLRAIFRILLQLPRICCVSFTLLLLLVSAKAALAAEVLFFAQAVGVLSGT